MPNKYSVTKRGAYYDLTVSKGRGAATLRSNLYVPTNSGNFRNRFETRKEAEAALTEFKAGAGSARRSSIFTTDQNHSYRWAAE